MKSFAQEPREAAKFTDRSERLFRRTISATRQQAVYVPMMSFLPMVAQAAVLLVGGAAVVHGSLPLNQFISFNFYVAMLVGPLRQLGMWIGQSQRATASGERIFEIIDEPEEVADAPDAIDLPAGEGRIEFQGVTFEYADGPAGAGGDRSRAPRGQHRRADRAHGRRQDDARLARAALLRRDRGPASSSTASTSATCASPRCDARSA